MPSRHRESIHIVVLTVRLSPCDFYSFSEFRRANVRYWPTSGRSSSRMGGLLADENSRSRGNEATMQATYKLLAGVGEVILLLAAMAILIFAARFIL